MRHNYMELPSQIPLCQTEFLQDVCIAVGRRFSPARNPWASFTAEREMVEHDGETLERLSIWARTHYGTSANLTLWENKIIWVNVVLWAGPNNDEYRVGFYSQCDVSSSPSDRIAEAFRDTVSVSTRLCYGESPIGTMRRIWRHRGEIEIVGSLKKPKRPIKT